MTKNKKLFYGALAIVILAIFGIGLFFLSKLQQTPEPTKQIANKVLIQETIPQEGSVGSLITIIGEGFAAENDIAFDIPQSESWIETGYVLSGAPSFDGKTIEFVIHEGGGVCPFTVPRKSEACPDILVPWPEGGTLVRVINKNGESNKIELTILKDKREPEEYYGSSTYGLCQTDNNCYISGCNSEICQSSAEESLASICVVPDKPTPKQLGYKCKCADRKCQWLN